MNLSVRTAERRRCFCPAVVLPIPRRICCMDIPKILHCAILYSLAGCMGHGAGKDTEQMGAMGAWEREYGYCLYLCPRCHLVHVFFRIVLRNPHTGKRWQPAWFCEMCGARLSHLPEYRPFFPKRSVVLLAVCGMRHRCSGFAAA